MKKYKGTENRGRKKKKGRKEKGGSIFV